MKIVIEIDGRETGYKLLKEWLTYFKIKHTEVSDDVDTNKGKTGKDTKKS